MSANSVGAARRLRGRARQAEEKAESAPLHERVAFDWSMRKKFYRHVAKKVNNGLTVEQALEEFRQRMVRRRSKSMQKIIGNIARLMRNGAGLNRAMLPWVPSLEASLIASGEEKGNLPDALELILKVEGSRRRVLKAYLSAAVRPLWMAALLFISVWVVGYYIMPMLQQSMPQSKATGLAAALFTVGRWSQSAFAAVVPVAYLGYAALVHWSKPRWTGASRAWADQHIGTYRMYRNLEGYAWIKSFIGLMKAGKSDVEAVEFQMRHATPWLAERLVSIKSSLLNGKKLHEALLEKRLRLGGQSFNFPDPDIIDDIASLQGFSDFEESIEEVVDEWANELEEATRGKAAFMGMVFDLLMYLIVVFLVLAMQSIADQMMAATRFF